MTCFTDPLAISSYVENATRRVPGLDHVHRMAGVLLAESTPPNGRVLVVGAGGGMELTFLARSYPDWRFDGVDPSAEMLNLARAALGTLTPRVQLHHGFVETASHGPFDASTCLLTLHFLPAEERLKTLRQIHARLKPGAVFVSMHYSVEGDGIARKLWLARCAAFAVSNGVAAVDANNAAIAIDNRLPILTPQEDEALMREAGFKEISTFYSALAFRGWVAHA